MVDRSFSSGAWKSLGERKRIRWTVVMNLKKMTGG